MIAALCNEMKLRRNELKEQELNSVYFGGGTPSLLTANEIQQIMSTVRELFSLSELAEVTLEANPDDISVSTLKSWKDAGFNRLSIGLQSFKDEDLKWMNRAHTKMEAEAGLRLIAVETGLEVVIVLLSAMEEFAIPHLVEG